MDIMTILCKVMLFMCLILSFPTIIGCIILTVVGDWFDRCCDMESFGLLKQKEVEVS